ITYWNTAAERILGYRGEEFAGMQVCTIFTPQDVTLGIPQEEGRRATDEGQTVDERWHMRKDGTTFWANGVTTPIKNDEGEILGFCKLFRNLTLRKHTEDAIRSANTQLSEFAHTAAHDLQ